MKVLLLALSLLLLPVSASADEAEVARIRAHLEAVEAELRAASAPSPDVEERRAVQLDRLNAYHRAGRFPFNDVRSERIPIFIDSNGTACAVAHLLIEDGQSELAADIDARYHDAYVREMELPAIALWAAGAGLRVDELARIQPTYDPPEELVPFYEACSAGSVGRMERTFAQVRTYAAGSGADVLHAVNTCLTRASWSGRLKAVRWALDQGGEANRVDPGTFGTGDPLLAALTSGHREVAELLVEHGARPVGRTRSVLDMLVDGEDPAARLDLYASLWPLDLATPSPGNTAMVHRVANDALRRPQALDTLRALLSRGLSPLAVHEDGITVLDLALLRHASTLADALTAWSESPSKAALHAARSASAEVFSAAFAGTGDSLQSRWLLQEAVAAGNVEVVRELLRSGTAPRPPGGGMRPLMLAVDRRATPTMLSVLVDAERPMDDRYTPLPLARLVKQNGVTVADRARYRVLLDALQTPRFAAHRDRELVEALRHLLGRCAPGDLEYIEELLDGVHTNLLPGGDGGPCGAPVTVWREKRLAEELARAEALQSQPPAEPRTRWTPEEDSGCSCATSGSLALLPVAFLMRRRRT